MNETHAATDFTEDVEKDQYDSPLIRPSADTAMNIRQHNALVKQYKDVNLKFQLSKSDAQKLALYNRATGIAERIKALRELIPSKYFK